jgi:arsenate reductase
MNKKNILFICTHNSCRSQIAEGILNAIYGSSYNAFSAGNIPNTVNSYVIEILKEIGIDLSKHASKSIEEFRGKEFDYVVTLCDNAKETCPYFPGKKLIHRDFPDPADAKGSKEDILNVFRKVRDQIKDFVIETFKKKYEK